MQPCVPSSKRPHPRAIDGLFLRKLAYLGSAHAPEWFKRSAPHLIAALTFSLVTERRQAAVRNLERVLGADRFTAHWADAARRALARAPRDGARAGCRHAGVRRGCARARWRGGGALG
jgi:lauroyl/myristoyl acyltransferase